jgi:hypothetical protein
MLPSNSRLQRLSQFCPVLSFSSSLRARYSHSSACPRRLPQPKTLSWRRTVARPKTTSCNT